jgi:aryl-phospho-beta-D-glucosidase BglC (GH1 family)
MQKRIFLITLLLGFFTLQSQNTLPIIFNDANESMITGTWQGMGTLTKITNSAQCEGIRHYSFNYSATDWWAGFGLNMNNWATTPGIINNFSSYTHLRITYKGMSSGQRLLFRLRNAYGTPEFSNDVEIGPVSSTCKTVDIPISALLAGNSFNIGSVTELNFSLASTTQVFSGSVIVDDIRLVNIAPTVYPVASINAWESHSKMYKGVNFTNWLEAYWLIPFNAYPEATKYNRSLVTDLHSKGFKAIRLPVTFERVADNSPGDTLPDVSIVWNLVDSTLQWASDLGMTVSICNHHGLDMNDGNYISQIIRIKKIWGQVMRRYKNTDPKKIFFELYNEPNNISNGNFREVAQALIDTIRSKAPNHTIVVGGNGWNSATGLTSSFPYQDNNIVYTFHTYDPYFFTHQGMSWTSPPNFPAKVFPEANSSQFDIFNHINNVSAWSQQYKVPVMMGEFGVSVTADATSRCNYVDSIAVNTRKHTMPWYYWDVITMTDAFGFYNGVTMISCFANSLKLSTSNICPSMVSAKSDIGETSLRAAVLCSYSGQVLQFSSSLANDTIKLVDKPIFLHHNLIMQNANTSKVKISSSSNMPIFKINQGVTLTLENFEILGQVNDLFINAGTLILKNCTVKSASGIPINNFGNVIIQGNSTIR